MKKPAPYWVPFLDSKEINSKKRLVVVKEMELVREEPSGESHIPTFSILPQEVRHSRAKPSDRTRGKKGRLGRCSGEGRD